MENVLVKAITLTCIYLDDPLCTCVDSVAITTIIRLLSNSTPRHVNVLMP